MTRYQTILNLKDDFVKLIAKGIVPVHLLDWKVYYEAYLKEVEDYRQKHGKVRKTHVACSVADNYKISERQIYTIISFMESGA